MSAKRTFKNKDEFIAGINDLAKMQVRLAKLSAGRDLEIQRVQERHSPEIESLNEDKDDLFERLEQFAADNREEVFSDAECKTEKTELAAFRFFFPPPKIAFLNRKFNEERVLSLMKTSGKFAAFVRPKEEIDRASLLAGIAEKNITPAELAEVGLKQTQTEKFEVKPLVESGEKVTS